MHAADRSPVIPVFGSSVAVALVLLFAVLSVIVEGIAGESGALSASPGPAPHLALAPIFLWLVRRGGVAGPLGAFAAGLTVDALTSCPLGVTAAAYVAFHFIAMREGETLFALPGPARFAVFTVLAAGVTGVQIGALTALGGAPPSPAGFAIALLAALAVYPLAAALRGPAPHRPALRGPAR